ncbi:MAG: hypothetical protein HY226_01560 [Candidatus Vogelbacteria bacterium]|nr:hypothetical protein [Candidatus Vogelbacteria bacterium]
MSAYAINNAMVRFEGLLERKHLDEIETLGGVVMLTQTKHFVLVGCKPDMPADRLLLIGLYAEKACKHGSYGFTTRIIKGATVMEFAPQGPQ